MYVDVFIFLFRALRFGGRNDAHEFINCLLDNLGKEANTAEKPAEFGEYEMLMFFVIFV